MRTGGRRDHPVSLGTLWCSLGLVGFTVFIVVRPEGRSVRPWSLGSLGCALEVDGFVRCRWDHLGTPWGSSGSSGDPGFIGVRTGVPQVHLGSLDSSG